MAGEWGIASNGVSGRFLKRRGGHQLFLLETPSLAHDTILPGNLIGHFWKK
jgi:hypothetical protein